MDALTAYLQTHLAGSRAGVDLFARSAKGQLDEKVGLALDDIRRQVIDEQAQLRQIMRLLGIQENRVRSTAARLGERVARLKPNGSLLHRTPLTDLVELEALRIAVSGKQAGWESLRALCDHVPSLDSDQLDRLVEQGQAQLERLGELHSVAAQRALVPPVTPQ